jgi:hypothetical protein
VSAIAQWDYQADDATEISFEPGALITHIECVDAGWWLGSTVDASGKSVRGLFPANYVQQE